MKHRKCDSTKYRRRMKKEQENRDVRQQREILENAHLAGPQEVRALEPPAVICPLCKLPVTVDDAVMKNMATITVNGKPVQVHKTCPMEVKK